MFKNKTHINSLSLALTGVAIATMGVYIQVVSMDLGQYSLVEYLKSDVKHIEWWQVVVLPIFTGSIFIVGAIISLRFSNAKKIFLTTLTISILTLPFHILAGGAGVLTSVVLLLSHAKHNPSFKRDS